MFYYIILIIHLIVMVENLFKDNAKYFHLAELWLLVFKWIIRNDIYKANFTVNEIIVHFWRFRRP